jgi:hypothetical protein
VRKNLFLSCLALFILSISLVVSVEASSKMWSQTYGGTKADCGTSLVKTIDGGYAIAGFTSSFATGTSSIQDSDFWLVKTDAYGNMEWNKTYGGTEYESVDSLVATSDGGYVFGGGTYSFGAGDMDFWLIRTDATGNMEWNQTYGGTEFDSPEAMIQTSDGGYAIVGFTWSFGAGWADFWLVKTDVGGNIVWNQTYGGEYWDGASSFVATSDGGYALVGITCDSPSLEFQPHEILLVKTDTNGNMEWNKTYGPTVADGINSLVETSDGGYAMAGSTSHIGDGRDDFVLIKTDELGNIQWNRTYAGPDSDYAISLVATSDSGFVIAGKTQFKAGVNDIWVVKTDMYGNMEWNQTYGGTDEDSCGSVIATSDGGYAIAGGTRSFGAGNWDFWLVKTDEYGIVPEYSSWLLTSLLLTATLVIVIYKKKFFDDHP